MTKNLCFQDDPAMKRCVVTLPLAQKEDPHIGFFLTPVVADMMARYGDMPLVLALNRTGRRFATRNRRRATRHYMRVLRGLRVNPARLWRDDRTHHAETVREVTGALLAEGAASLVEEGVYICPCGMVELPEASLRPYTHTRDLYQISNGVPVCRRCNQAADVTETQSIYLTAPRQRAAPPLHVYPDVYVRDVERLREQCLSVPWRLSRLRRTRFQLAFGDGLFYLDVDYAWSLFLTDLARRGYTPTALVNGNRTLRQVVAAVLLNYWVGEWKPERFDAIITPYVLGPGKDELRGRDYEALALTERYDATTLRLWLGQYLRWGRKDVSVDTGEIHWVMASVNDLRSSLGSRQPVLWDAKEFLSATAAEQVRDGLTAARKGRLRHGGSYNLAHVVGLPVGRAGEAPYGEAGREPYVPFIERLRREMGGNLVCVLRYGSATRPAVEAVRDHDLAVILYKKTPVSNSIVARVAAAVKLPAMWDLHIVYLEELLADGDFFSWRTCGAFFMVCLRGAEVLFGKNPFERARGPSAYQLRISLLQKLQQYVMTARQVLCRPGREVSETELYYFLKRLWLGVRDLLIWVKRDQIDPEARFVELQVRFPGQLEERELRKLREWLGWLPDLWVMVTRLTPQRRKEVLSEVVEILESVHRVGLELAREQYGLVFLPEILGDGFPEREV